MSDIQKNSSQRKRSKLHSFEMGMAPLNKEHGKWMNLELRLHPEHQPKRAIITHHSSWSWSSWDLAFPQNRQVLTLHRALPEESLRGAVRKITSQNMAKKTSFCPRNLTKNLETMHHVPKVEWVLSTVSTSRMVALLEGLGNCHCACLAGRAAATTMWHLRNHASPQRPNIPQRRRFTGMFHLLQVMLKDSISRAPGVQCCRSRCILILLEYYKTRFCCKYDWDSHWRLASVKIVIERHLHTWMNEGPFIVAVQFPSCEASMCNQVFQQPSRFASFLLILKKCPTTAITG